MTIDDLRKVPKKFIRDVFGYSYQALAKWNDKLKEIGADNGDRTYDLIKIIRWKCEEKKKGDSEDKAELEIQKLQKEIEYKAAQVEKVKENFVERSIAEAEMTAFARSVSSFLERVPSFHKQKFHMIHADVAEKRLRDLFKEACEQLANAPDVDNG